MQTEAELAKAYPWAVRVIRFDDDGRYPGLLEEMARELGRPLQEKEIELSVGWLPPRTWWKPGPWLVEPDFIEWRSPVTPDLPLILARGTGGALCGYVGLPLGHPLHGSTNFSGYEPSEGLSWSSPSGRLLTATGERPDHRWVGFDCAHVHREYVPTFDVKDDWMEAVVGLKLPRGSFERLAKPEQYVDVNEVRRRTEALALSLVPR